MAHPEKRWVKDSEEQLLQTADISQDAKKEDCIYSAMIAFVLLSGGTNSLKRKISYLFVMNMHSS